MEFTFKMFRVGEDEPSPMSQHFALYYLDGQVFGWSGRFGSWNAIEYQAISDMGMFNCATEVPAIGYGENFMSKKDD